jgi:uncharacterized protein YndB with AHSA1/START domain
MNSLGKMISPDTLRFERILPGPIEKVWAYLTESDKREKWLARGEMELFEGGRVSLQFHHSDLSPEPGDPPEKFKEMLNGHAWSGKVLKIDPPRLLSFTWEGASEVTFELEEQGAEVLLSLTHRKLPIDGTTRTNVQTGWHTHLTILRANLEGNKPPNFWRKWAEVEQRYQQQQDPAAKTGMLIRKRPAETFEAFVDPVTITKFWFTRSTGRLEQGKTVDWIWDMYNLTSKILVKALVPDKRIEIEWGIKGHPRTRVEWTFEPVEDQFTFVDIRVDGFTGDEDTIRQMVKDSETGFCWVLAGAKAWLEFDIQLNLVRDRFYGGRK